MFRDIVRIGLFTIFHILIFCSSGLTDAVSLYTGQHSESFKLTTLHGTGELGLDLVLNYNGNVKRVAEQRNAFSQASPFGLGFSIDRMTIISDHRSSATLNDDQYALQSGSSSHKLMHIADSTYVLATGEAWKLYRHIDSSITDVPIIVGWTVVRDDGTIYRFGSFNDSSVYEYNANRSILRYGEHLGAGITDDAEPFPVGWDLSMIHTRDTSHWIQYIYWQECDSLLVLDSLDQQTGSDYFTRQSHIDEIRLSDGSKVEFRYSDREDFEEYYGVNIYEHYSSKRIRAIDVFGPNGDSLSTIKFTYTYLNKNEAPQFKKLLLKGFRIFNRDQTDSLPATGFFYFMDKQDLAFGSIREVYYPTGKIKRLHYSGVSINDNCTATTTLLSDTMYNPPGNKVEVYTNDLIYYSEQVDSVEIGIWDGFWRMDTTSLTGNELLDIPAISTGWISYYDRSEGSIIVKRWMDGYWKTDVLNDQISVTEGEYPSVRIITGDDCFLVNCGRFSEDTSYIDSSYLFVWDGNEWSGEAIEGFSSPDNTISSIQLNSNFFVISVYDENNDEGEVCFGLYDYEIKTLVDTTLAFNYVMKDSLFDIGRNYFTYFDPWEDTCVHLYRRANGEWNYSRIYCDSGNHIIGINAHKNGLVFGTYANEYYGRIYSTFLTSDSIKVSQYAEYFTFIPFSSELQQSSHTLAVLNKSLEYGFHCYEWDGTDWEPVSDSLQYYDQEDSVWSMRLFPNSYAVDKQDSENGDHEIWVRRYLGNQEWSEAEDTIFSDQIPGITDQKIVYHDPSDSRIHLMYYDPFVYGGYKDYSTGDGTDSNFISAYPNSHFITYKDDPITPKYITRASAVLNHGFIGTKAPMLVVDTVYLFENEYDSVPIVRHYKYEKGLVDRSGNTPCFSKVTQSLPYFQGDTTAGGYVVYFYNDLWSMDFADGHIATTVTMPDLTGIQDSLGDTTLIFGIINGGFRLDGLPYLDYMYTTGEDTTEGVDYAYNYYKLYHTPDSAILNDVYTVQIDSTITRKNTMVNKTVNFYNTYNRRLTERQVVHENGDSVITKRIFAYEDPVDTVTAASMKTANAISQILDESLYHFDSSSSTTTLLSKSGRRYADHAGWIPVS